MTGPDPYQRFIDTALRNARSSEVSGHRRISDAARDLRDRMRALAEETATATDEAGYVEATVRLGGELIDVRISAYAMRDLSADALGPACVEAIAAARTRAGEAMSERLEELVGATLDLPPDELIPPGYRRMPEVVEFLKAMRG
jgi:DNA-binding protein YbaB